MEKTIMEKSYSEKLRVAKKEIETVLKKHDIAGSIILADGEGMGEFGYFVTTPTWSGLTPNEQGFRIQLKMKTDEGKLNANKTVNACVVLRDVLANQFVLADRLVKAIEDHVKIETTSEPQFKREYLN